MKRMFITLEGNISICCLNENNECYFYAQHDYEDDILDLLYNYIISCGVQKIVVYLQGDWDSSIASDSYVCGHTMVSGAQFYGSVKQLDVNKLAHLFKSADIDDVVYVDKMSIYEQIANERKTPTCLIDRVNSAVVLVVFDSRGDELEIRELSYVVSTNLLAHINTIRTFYGSVDFVDVQQYLLSSDIELSKFELEDQVKISQMTCPIKEHSTYVLNKDKIAFSSNFTSYENPAESDSVSNLDESLMNDFDVPATDLGNTLKLDKTKKKSNLFSILLTILIILCALSAIGVFVINKVIGNDLEGLKRKLESVEIEFSNAQDIYNCMSVEQEYDSALAFFLNTEVEGVQISCVDMYTDTISVCYYVADVNAFNSIVKKIERKYTTNVTEIRTIEEAGNVYYEKCVEVLL